MACFPKNLDIFSSHHTIFNLITARCAQVFKITKTTFMHLIKAHFRKISRGRPERIVNDANVIFVSDCLYKSVCCEYPQHILLQKKVVIKTWAVT